MPRLSRGHEWRVLRTGSGVLSTYRSCTTPSHHLRHAVTVVLVNDPTTAVSYLMSNTRTFPEQSKRWDLLVCVCVCVYVCVCGGGE